MIIILNLVCLSDRYEEATRALENWNNFEDGTEESVNGSENEEE
jgi:hypothetical protein